jgi:hypothetical protein
MFITNRACLCVFSVMIVLSPPGVALADPAIKPALSGLISTGSPSNTLAQLARPEVMGIFGGIVIQATWNQIEPTEGKFDFSIIDDALSQTANDTKNGVTNDNVTDYNNAVANNPNLKAPNNRQIGVRLRIFAGCNDAPEWAMKKDPGFPIKVTAEYNSSPETCEFGMFWDTTSNYAKEWRKFQARLAAKYDANTLIQEVAVTSCTSTSAEPFFLNLKKPVYDPPKTVPAPSPLPPLPAEALRKAGFNDPAYRECLTNAIDDYSPWKATRLEFSFNGFNGLAGQNDIAVSERIMRKCRLTIGPRCILSNHDLDSATPSTILPIYVFERKFGPNITFQALDIVPTDFEGTLRKGISLGAGSIEIWQEPRYGSFEHQTRATLATWAEMFEPQ